MSSGTIALSHRLLAALALASVLLAAPGCAQDQVPAAATPALRAPDVRYEPSDMDVVQAMLKLAAIRPGDVVYDLGCGDGRIVIAALRAGAARGVCVDIDPQRIVESRANAQRAGVADRIEFLNQDLFETDFSRATVVMLFLWPDVNLKLRPLLQRDLKPGTRIVSHWHDMGDWKPQRTVNVTSEGRSRPLYLWVIAGNK